MAGSLRQEWCTSVRLRRIWGLRRAKLARRSTPATAVTANHDAARRVAVCIARCAPKSLPFQGTFVMGFAQAQ
jgi:hypothetical protein